MSNLDHILSLIRHFFVSNLQEVRILVCEDQVPNPQEVLEHLLHIYSDVSVSGRIGVSHKNGEAIDLQIVSDEGSQRFQISQAEDHYFLSRMNDFPMKVTGESPTLFLYHEDHVGVIAAVTSLLSERDINIARLDVHRRGKGQLALLVMELDSPIDPQDRQKLAQLPHITHVEYYLPPASLS
jgi:L-serine deaminase